MPATRGPDTGGLAVFITDEQTSQPVDGPRWARLAEDVLLDAGVEGEAELSIIFVEREHMAALNQQFMGHEGPTDVLSFPIDGVFEPSTSGLGPPCRMPCDPDDQPLLLGDIVICPDVAFAQAPTHAGTYEDELALLVVHGILHLQGMDHSVDEDRVAMQTRERALLSAFYGGLALDPWA